MHPVSEENTAIPRKQLQIGELASLVGVTTKTIRHYHKIGLLHAPERSKTGYRLYDAGHLVRLNRIVRLKSLSISLSQIQDISEAEDSNKALRETLDSLQHELAEQVEQLSRLLEKVSVYRSQQYSLVNIDLPDDPGKSFQYAQEHLKLPDDEDENPEMLVFDQSYMAELESINWPLSIQKMFEARVNQSANDEDLLDYRMRLLKEFARLRNLPEDAPEIVSAAWSIVQTDVGRKMSEIAKQRLNNRDMYEELFDETSEILAQERYTPAQYRFATIVEEMLLRL